MSISERAIEIVDNVLHARDSHNVEREIARMALASTATYVQNHLPLTRSFRTRLALLDWSLESVQSSGLYAEFGVYMGKTLNFIARRVPPGTVVYGFDSFKGLPAPWTADTPAGTFETKKKPKVGPNVRLVDGLFEDSLPRFLKEHRDPYAFIHIDSDVYSSARTVLTQLSARLRPGAVIVFDEFFNYPGWERHEFRAFSELTSAQHLEFEYLGYCKFGTQLSVRINRNPSLSTL